ncbi:MAG: hypothetical protein ABL921_22080 [Pirellula sp.]
MMSSKQLFGLAVFLVISSFILGCGSGERRYDISGTVTFKGKPVPEGYIVFEPDSSKGNSGGPGKAKILDGKYDTSAEPDSGVLGGPHVVRITGFEHKISGMTGSEVTLPKSLFTDYTVSEDLPKKNGKMDFDVKTK